MTYTLGRLRRTPALRVEEVDERRSSERIHVQAPVSLRVPSIESVLDGDLVNISKSGMFLAMSKPPVPGTRLEVEVSLGTGQLVLHATVEVVRQQLLIEPVGVGVRFVDIAFESQALIDRLLTDDRFFGTYRLERLLGRGGMAEVFLAKALDGPAAGRRVALKRILPSYAADVRFRELFLREAALGRSFRHPSVVEVYDVGNEEGVLYIAMEHVAGCDLKRVIAECRRRRIFMPVDFACYVVQTVAEALSHVHTSVDAQGKSRGVVHRDIAPSNIFISDVGEVKVGDFGVARDWSAGEDLIALAGKDCYLAPEQLLRQPVTGAADLFSLGAVLYEMITNEKAFTGKDPKQIAGKIIASDYVPPSRLRPDVPPAVERFIARALAPREASSSFFGKLLRKDGRAEPRFESAVDFSQTLSGLYDPSIGTQMAIASVVRGLLAA